MCLSGRFQRLVQTTHQIFGQLIGTPWPGAANRPGTANCFSIGQVVEIQTLSSGRLLYGRIAWVHRSGRRMMIAFVASHAVLPDSEILITWSGVSLRCRAHYCIAVALGYGVTAMFQ